MKLAISILVGLLIALLILKFTNLESYVLAPVTYERSMDFNPGDDEARIIRAVAAAAGANISEDQARAALAAASPPVGPPPIMPIPGTVTPMVAPSPTAAQQIMAQPLAVVQAAEAAKATQAAQVATASGETGGAFTDGGGGSFTGGGGGSFTGGGGVGAITRITGGGAPLMGGAAMQPITAGAAGFGAPAPAPKPPLSGAPAPAPAPSSARAPAPAPAPAPSPARRAPAPAPAGPKGRKELILEEVDEILAKLRS